MYDTAYDMLNEEYRNVRYGSLDKFTANMKEYASYILKAHVKDYTKIKDHNYIIFYDQYENGYYIDVAEDHNSKLYLDNYSIMTVLVVKSE